jgi:hypothetical protein
MMTKSVRAGSRPRRGRPHDDRDLRDHARRRGVQAEDLAVLAESDDALLDARAAGVEDADDRHPAAQGELHDLDDLVAATSPSEPPKVVKSCA